MRAMYITIGLLTMLAFGACAIHYPPESKRGETPSPAASPAGPMAGMGDMGDMAHDGMMKSSPDAASSPYDLQFIDTMSAHHQSAIDMAKMAEMKGEHAEVKTLARGIVATQQKEISQMKSWRDQWYAGKPPAMNMEMPGMMDAMKGLDMTKMKAMSGNAFDLMFIDMMTQHHEGAVTMAREALMKSEHPEIKRLAEQIIDAQEKEIAQMNKWKAAWGGGKPNVATSHTSDKRHDVSTGHEPGDFHPPTKP